MAFSLSIVFPFIASTQSIYKQLLTAAIHFLILLGNSAMEKFGSRVDRSAIIKGGLLRAVIYHCKIDWRPSGEALMLG